MIDRPFLMSNAAFWMQDYEKEEQNGVAIMQREKRLTDERAAITKTKPHGCADDNELCGC